MQSTSHANGRFVWFELMTTDPAAAIEFYGKVVGYTTESWGEGGGNYRMWKTPSGPTIGGIMELPQAARDMGAPPHWVGNLCVASVDEAVEKLKAHGGVVHHGPFDVPSIGRVAMVADAGGAGLALYQPEAMAPGHSEDHNVQGEISWVELCTSDMDQAWATYSDIGGWEKTDAMDMGPMGTYQMYGPQGKTIGGMMTKPPEMPFSAWLFYIWVDDLDAAIASAVANGGTLVHGPQEVPGGSRVANLIDPQGAHFALHGGRSAASNSNSAA